MVKERECCFISKTPLGEISIDYYGNLSWCDFYKCQNCILFEYPHSFGGCQDMVIKYLSTEYTTDDLSDDEIAFIDKTQQGFLFRKKTETCGITRLK